MSNVDPGKYNRNQKQYSRLIGQVYKEFSGGITLPPEYAHYIQNDLNRLLIRLARYKFVAKMIRKTDTVLEVGCGSGLGSMFLSQYCQFVTGLDIKTTEIEEAKSINKRDNVTFLEQDLYDLKAVQKYDTVAALDVIEHVSLANGKKLVAKMAHHLNPNGLLILGTPSIYSYPFQGKLSQASHVHCYGQEELVSMVEKYFERVLAFSMNDEMVHTGNPKMAWYYFVIAFGSKTA